MSESINKTSALLCCPPIRTRIQALDAVLGSPHVKQGTVPEGLGASAFYLISDLGYLLEGLAHD